MEVLMKMQAQRDVDWNLEVVLRTEERPHGNHHQAMVATIFERRRAEFPFGTFPPVGCSVMVLRRDKTG
jgi:hypothetical protein